MNRVNKRTAKTTRNNHLDEALAQLIQSQASLVSNQTALLSERAKTNSRIAAINSEIAETNRVNSERFARIEAELASIRTILLRHEQILQTLPETIREKIGFKPPA